MPVNWRAIQLPSPFLRKLPYQGEAPSISDRCGLVMIRSGSTCRTTPNPLQSGHMPSGELKLNRVGCNSEKLILQVGQALRSLRAISLPSAKATITTPLPAFRQVSIESIRRETKSLHPSSRGG